MTPLDATWHILNALAAPFWVSVLAVWSVKALWRRLGPRHRAMTLLGWTYAAGLLAYIGAWSAAGAEGTMWGYGAMVVAVALALWVRMFLWPR